MKFSRIRAAAVIMGAAFLLSTCASIPISDTPASKPTPSLSAINDNGLFREYPLPQSNDGLMRPAIDHRGRIWFGEMTRNRLAVFDPRTHAFQQITPPHGESGIMGVAVAGDDTIWFAEQYANYIGHFFPSSGQFAIYTLPEFTVPDPGDPQKTLSLPSAPNDIVIDARGAVWFTELNAGTIGKLDPRNGHLTQYLLAANKAQAQLIDPYGITVDPQGMIWFTEIGGKRIGRLNPQNGAISYFSQAALTSALMEIAADERGTLWITSFNSNLLLSFDPRTGLFTPHYAPGEGRGSGGIYGVTFDAEGQVWVTLAAQNAIAQFDIAARRFTDYPIPTAGSLPLGIVSGPSHQLWFTEAGSNMIGMLHT